MLFAVVVFFFAYTVRRALVYITGLHFIVYRYFFIIITVICIDKNWGSLRVSSSSSVWVCHHHHLSLNVRVTGAPQMISQLVSSIFPCSPLPSGTWQTPGLSIPWRCLPTSSSVFLVFIYLSLFLARWFWPDLMYGKNDNTTAVCVSLRSPGGLRVVQLPAGSWHGFPRW